MGQGRLESAKCGLGVSISLTYIPSELQAMWQDKRDEKSPICLVFMLSITERQESTERSKIIQNTFKAKLKLLQTVAN